MFVLLHYVGRQYSGDRWCKKGKDSGELSQISILMGNEANNSFKGLETTESSIPFSLHPLSVMENIIRFGDVYQGSIGLTAENMHCQKPNFT